MGKPAVYNIVSNVDAIIILKNPCVEFAKWGEPAPLKVEKTAPSIADETVESENWKDWPIRLSKKDKKKKKKRWEQARDRTMDQAQLIGEVAITPDIGGPSSSSIVPEVSLGSTQPSIFGAGPSEIIGTVAREDKDSNSLPIDIEARKAKRIPKATMKSNQEDGIRFRVCAGNLMSASPWFNRTLKRDGWKESDWNQEDKCYYISARDWDEEAFLILMNIFHLRNRDVPRKVTLETLAKIAVLADYYECSESIELFVDMWVADLQANTSVPATYCRDLILWIWVSWAFKMLEIFTQVTRTAIKQCDEPCRNLGLPIPARVTSKYHYEHSIHISYIEQTRSIKNDTRLLNPSFPDCMHNLRCIVAHHTLALLGLSFRFDAGACFLAPSRKKCTG